MKIHPIAGTLSVLILFLQPVTLFSSPAKPQTQPAPVEQAGTPLSADQLDDLVAPIALYPDALLSQVLVACTYPIEIVEASQWLQRNPTLKGTALTRAAQQQNWDPSVQALVVFPDVVKRLSEDITWTMNLGNAFLAQETDVMDAVQRARTNAQRAAKLTSTSQQTVTTRVESGRSIIVITPSRPDVIYVPVYDPVWIWGPWVHYPYPRWHYPPRPVVRVVVIFGPPIIITNFLVGPWVGWNAWGWYPAWPTHRVIIDTVFVHRYNFNASHLPRVTGPTVWTHDSFHRQGVPYPNRTLNDQYRAGTRQNLKPRPPAPQTQAPLRSAPRPAREPTDRIGDRRIPASPPARNRGAFGGIENGDTARKHTDRGRSSLGSERTNPARARSERPAAGPSGRSSSGARQPRQGNR